MSDVKTVPDASGLRFGLVAARFHPSIVEGLISGARQALLRKAVPAEQIEIVRVPGAWEIPPALDALADTGRFDALVALGAVIRGQTRHFDYICNECAAGCARVMARTGLAVGFGVLTCEDRVQATARSGDASGNKGVEAAEAALEMAHLLRSLRP